MLFINNQVPVYDPEEDNCSFISVPISQKYTIDSVVTTENAKDYVNSMCLFKLWFNANREIDMLREGLNSIVEADYLDHFSASDFLLLLNGSEVIDIDEWRRETVCSGWVQMVKWLLTLNLYQ